MSSLTDLVEHGLKAFLQKVEHRASLCRSLDDADPDELVQAAESESGLRAVAVRYSVDDVALEVAQELTAKLPEHDEPSTDPLAPNTSTVCCRVITVADWVHNRHAAWRHLVASARPMPETDVEPAIRIPNNALVDGKVFRRLWLNFYLTLDELLDSTTNLAQSLASEREHHVFTRYYTEPAYDDSLKREYVYTEAESPGNYTLNIWRKRVYRLSQYAKSMHYARVGLTTEHEWAVTQEPLFGHRPKMILCRHELAVYLVMPEGQVYGPVSRLGPAFALAASH